MPFKRRFLRQQHNGRARDYPNIRRAWLIRVASRRLTDQIRSDVARRRRETLAAMESGYVIPAAEIEVEVSSDDTLNLIYMCCHPELTRSSAIALTLRAVGGLSTGEIAHAFLVPEATMAQRISRAKQTIKDSRVPFRPPGAGEQTERLGAVLHVLYLIFNEGYSASWGEVLQRNDLASEAIRLTRLLRTLLPHDPEVAGLLALMLLTDARRAARIGPHGEVIPLNRQERTLWDRPQIDEGVTLISAVLPRGPLDRTRFKPLSLQFTTKPFGAKTPTGRKFSLCITSSNGCPIIPWSG